MLRRDTHIANTPIRNPPRNPLKTREFFFFFFFFYSYPIKLKITNIIKLYLNISHESLNATLDKSLPVYNGTKTSAKIKNKKYDF